MKTREMAQFENQVQSELARQNHVPGDWRKTVIAETPGAVASDPLRGNFYGGDYNDVRIFPISDNAQKRSRGAIRSLERIASRQSKSASRGRRSHAMDHAPIRLDPDAPAREAVAALQSRASFSKTRHAWWQGLWEYVRKFPVSTKVRDLDARTVKVFLKQI